MKRMIVGLFTVISVLTLLPLAGFAAPSSQAKQPQGAIRLTGGEQCFAETGHCLRGVFRGYWAANGGITRFGLPITDELTEGGLTVLYTERARFEFHPENRGTDNVVLLGLLGKELTVGREKEKPFQRTPAQGNIATVYFDQTGHNLAAIFGSYWQANGGLAVYGYPISEAFEEKSATDGKTYLVQYFERNRFEYHPELPAAYQVSLGLLGKQAYQKLYGNAPAPIPGKDYGPAPISLAAFRQEMRWGNNLRTLSVLEQGGSYTKYSIAYSSGELNISGVMYVPAAQGDGPFPVIILGHGYIPIAEYYTGEDSRREGPYLAQNGCVAIHPDFRNYATSDDDPNAEVNMTAPGWTEDTLNLLDALKRTALPYIDATRVGYWGHSNGGQVGLQLSVTQSEIKAFVLFAPTSPNYADNFNRWQRVREGSANGGPSLVKRKYGYPEDNPTFYAGISFAPNAGRVSAPMMINHGQSDTNTPYAWSVESNRLLVAAGKDVTFLSPRSENHLFSDNYWPTAAKQMLAYYEAHVR